MTSKHTKVLIVGGSVAGLALANMLERAGIDFLVLEKYSNVAPDLGAGIGLLPNGARILDQLGCWNELEKLADGSDAMRRLLTRDQSGTPILELDFATRKMVAHFGYGLTFVGRKDLVQILFDNLKDKSKVLVGKDVASLLQLPDQVQAFTRDGGMFSGNVLVGADGVHSIIRKEMWRLADLHEPGYFPPKERTEVASTYCCAFGISASVPGFDAKSGGLVIGEGYSYLISGGPKGQIYWGLFSKLNRAAYGLYDKLPRFNETDLSALAEEHRKDKISETLYFAQLWDSRKAATLTALPEYVFSKWHYGRIVTVGDAAHKLNPITGQGGNSAIETCATLANLLHKQENIRSSSLGLSSDDATHVFEQLEIIRRARMTQLVKDGRLAQSIHAKDTLVSKLIASLLRYVREDQFLDQLGSAVKPATHLEMLNIPDRPRLEPYLDERQSKPKTMAVPLSLVGLTLLYIAYKALKNRSYPEASSSGVRLYPFDMNWTLSTSLLENVPERSPLFGAQSTPGYLATYASVALLPQFIIWTVESYRQRNRWTPIAWPSMFGLMSTCSGVNFAAAAYYLASLIGATSDPFAGRRVPESVAQTIPQAAVLGCAILVLVLFLPTNTSSQGLLVQEVLPFAPVLVGLLTFVLSNFRKVPEREIKKATDVAPVVFSQRDVPHLQWIYRLTAVLSFIAHIAVVGLVVSSSQESGISLTKILLPEAQNNTDSSNTSWTTATSLDAHRDLIGAIAAMLTYSVFTIVQLHHQGIIPWFRMVKAIGVFGIGAIVAGPGAAMAGLWSWREATLASYIPAIENKRRSASRGEK